MKVFKDYEKQWYNFASIKKQNASKILKQNLLTIDGKTMKFVYFIHGERPNNGYSLVFGFHGGGGCAPQVNDQQWNNHMHLYDKCLPSGIIWFVFRSAQNLSDMWWRPYFEKFILKIIHSFTIMGMINPNKVFLTGFSAGGDGIYHMGPRMADVLAGAAMMAGHPNNVEMYNVRNIAFAIHVGQKDDAYNRNNLGKQYINKLNQLQALYGGFKHYSQIHQGKPHWLNLEQSKIFPQFFKQSRDPYPEYIIFKQHPRAFKKTFYYIKLQQKHQDIIYLRRKGNKIQIQSGKFPVTIMLNRNFIDFDQKVQIWHNGQITGQYYPQVDKKLVQQSIFEYADPYYIFQDQVMSIPNKSGLDLPILRPLQIQNQYKGNKQADKKPFNNIQNKKNPNNKYLKSQNQLGSEMNYSQNQQLIIPSSQIINPYQKHSKKNKKSEDDCCVIY